MSDLNQLKASAESLTSSLDSATGYEHHYSKQTIRFFKQNEISRRDIISKFKFMINQNDGLLNSIDNELIQLCYPVESKDHEEERIKQFIDLLQSKTEFVKQLFLIPNSSPLGFE